MGSGTRAAKIVSALSAATLLLLSIVLPRTAGASTVRDARDGFSVSLPARWRQIPLNSSDVRAVLQGVTKAAPNLAAVLDRAVEQATASHLRFFAVGPLSGRFFPNFNVGVESAPRVPLAGELLPLLSAQVKVVLTMAGALHLHLTQPTLPLGKALEVRYNLPLGTAGLPHVHGIQYYVPHGTSVYVLTFTAASAAANAAVARRVSASWRWR